MKYCFKSSIAESEGSYFVSIPFNIWEVCSSQGTVSVKVYVNDKSFLCELTPRGNGLYNIPINEELYRELGSDVHPFSIKILNHVSNMSDNSPYSSDHPIRIIDSMKLVTQPFDGLCGQTCIAMLAGITLDESCEIMHCREWQANMGKIIDTLDYMFIHHTNTVYYTQGEEVTLPKCAVIMEKMGRFSHYLIYFDGTYYDPTSGILPEFDMKNMVGYLEILTA